jgi:hypothetical protein
MKTLDRTYADKKLHGMKGKNTYIEAKGEFGKVEVVYINKRYKVTAINKETKQHFSKAYATLAGAMVAFDNLKEYWI